MKGNAGAMEKGNGWKEDPSYFEDCGEDCPVECVSWEMLGVYRGVE